MTRFPTGERLTGTRACRARGGGGRRTGLERGEYKHFKRSCRIEIGAGALVERIDWPQPNPVGLSEHSAAVPPRRGPRLASRDDWHVWQLKFRLRC